MNPAWATLGMVGTMGLLVSAVSFWLLYRQKRQAEREREQHARKS